MKAYLQCNDKINWISMREIGSQDHKKEMKGSDILIYIPVAVIY